MSEDWYIYENNVVCGPFSLDILSKMTAEGRVSAETMTRRGRYSSWHRAGEQPLLDEMMKKTVSNAKTETCVNSVPTGGIVPDGVLSGVSSDDGSIRVKCPSCGQKYKIPAADYSAGAAAKCIKCEKEFILPAAGNASAVSHVQEDPNLIPEGPIACPHCFKTFPKERVLYISTHPALAGDDIAGEFEQKRFAPSVFDSRGLPLDPKGSVCTDMACPHCHLRLPSAIVDLDSLHFSIVGAPASGKSYYVTALVHSLRRIMPQSFSNMFADTDPLMNRVIDNYENTIFASSDPESISFLPKTQQTGGDFSSHVTLNGVPTDLAKPFIFELNPMNGGAARNIIFYDNAGEHFQPGADTLLNPATEHLAHSDGIIFLFDPLNDAAMRKKCESDDPQLEITGKISDQTVLFSEMTTRLRRHKNMTAQEKCSIPIVVAVNKYDAWKNLILPLDASTSDFTTDSGNSLDSALDMGTVLDISCSVRALMEKFAPGLVGAAETFFEKVLFVPVSSFGASARKSPDGVIGIKTSELSPVWVEVPFLLLAAWNGIIGVSNSFEGVETTPVPDGAAYGESIAFRDPETMKRRRLPDIYAGALVTIGGKRYRLPPAAVMHDSVKKDLWS